MTLSLRQIISQTLKTSRQRKENFSLALESLLSGRKPAILFDFCATTTDQLASIVEQSGLKNVVLVVKLQDDIVLVDKRHEFVAGYRPVFVDCSRSLGTPVVA